MSESFTDIVVKVIKKIPKGKVATYGQIAALSGSPRAARQVVRILHTQSKKEKLPWHRIINSKGEIALREFEGLEEQRELLEKEGIVVKNKNAIDLKIYQWHPK